MQLSINDQPFAVGRLPQWLAPLRQLPSHYKGEQNMKVYYAIVHVTNPDSGNTHVLTFRMTGLTIIDATNSAIDEACDQWRVSKQNVECVEVGLMGRKG
jgi:hypothetical protein